MYIRECVSEIWEYLFRRLNTRPREGLNGEGWLVGERRDTSSYASKSSKSSIWDTQIYKHYYYISSFLCRTSVSRTFGQLGRPRCVVIIPKIKCSGTRGLYIISHLYFNIIIKWYRFTFSLNITCLQRMTSEKGLGL